MTNRERNVIRAPVLVLIAVAILCIFAEALTNDWHWLVWMWVALGAACAIAPGVEAAERAAESRSVWSWVHTWTR